MMNCLRLLPNWRKRCFKQSKRRSAATWFPEKLSFLACATALESIAGDPRRSPRSRVNRRSRGLVGVESSCSSGAIADEIQRALALIRNQPRIGAVARNPRLPGVRRVHLSRVHYHLYYRVTPEAI